MAEWKSGFVDVNGLRLHYTRTAGDKPPLVLAHGVTDDGLCWAPLAEALADEYDVIMVDARGHGRSEASEAGYGPGQQANDLAALIAALELRRPAVLGHSMGAATALVLAGAYPELPGAVLLEDPPSWWDDFYETEESHERLATLRERFTALKHLTREEMLEVERTEHPVWSDAELEPWAAAKERFSLNVLSVLDQNNPADVEWQTILPRVTCPVLLITGDPDQGAIVTDDAVAALREMVPHLEVKHVPGAGHNIRRDRFGPYLDVVRAFLDRHRAAISS